MSTFLIEQNHPRLEEQKLTMLALKMKQGDERAAEMLYNELVEKVYEFCISRLNDQKSAEELTQEIFLRLINRIESFNLGQGDFLAWFWRLARGAMFDYYHRQRHLSPLGALFITMNISFVDFGDERRIKKMVQENHSESSNEALGNKLHKKNIRQNLQESLNTLSPEEQEILNLHYLADLSYDEIARVVEKPKEEVYEHINDIKNKIRNSLTMSLVGYDARE